MTETCGGGRNAIGAKPPFLLWTGRLACYQHKGWVGEGAEGRYIDTERWNTGGFKRAVNYE